MKYTYFCLNPIARVGIDQWTDDYEETFDPDQANAMLVRSADMHQMSVSEELLAVARAGAGVNNIPLDALTQKGVVVFNTPGANANGVKELVIAGLLLASRDIVGGINWVQDHADDAQIAADAEKAKKAFAGCELEGRKLGVIGLGAIGVQVANAACGLGMEVYGYDPYLSVDSAWRLSRSVHHAKAVEELYADCDYITLHVPASDATAQMINTEAIGQMKPGVVILNFARDVLVDEAALVAALTDGKVKHYVCDFPTPGTVGAPGAIIIPHLGASTQESEDHCAVMAVNQLRDYLENGNITNSVNVPNCTMGVRGADTRITILHQNVPNMIGQFSKILGDGGLNIENMTNKSKGAYAYTMLDVKPDLPAALKQDLEDIPGTIRVRVLD